MPGVEPDAGVDPEPGVVAVPALVPVPGVVLAVTGSVPPASAAPSSGRSGAQGGINTSTPSGTKAMAKTMPSSVRRMSSKSEMYVVPSSVSLKLFQTTTCSSASSSPHFVSPSMYSSPP